MPSDLMNLASHPLWLVGFRPFFALACIAGASLPILWALIFSGAVPPAPTFAVPPLQWHAHEMFYGFGWAVLGGFLLTSTKNWVGIRGYHGTTLMALVAAWVVDRIGMSFGGGWPPLLQMLSSTAFQVLITAALMATLIRHRASDSYPDNLYFILALPLFIAAKILLLNSHHFVSGQAMTLALFRVAFLLMLERTLTQFMKGVFQISLPRMAVLDHGIKGLAFLLVVAPWLPQSPRLVLSLLLALLLLARWLWWRPDLALRRLDIAIMYLGYLAIVAQLLIESIGQYLGLSWVGSLSVHVFTVGAMGFIVPAMLIRISRGHTGRKVVFDRGDKAALWLMMAAFLLRVLAPQVLPAAYPLWMLATAVGWLLCFGLLGWRYIPFLLEKRADGKAH